MFQFLWGFYLTGHGKKQGGVSQSPARTPLIGKQLKVALGPRVSGSKPCFTSKRNSSLKLQSSLSQCNDFSRSSVQTPNQDTSFSQMLPPAVDLVLKLFVEQVLQLGKQFQCVLCCRFHNFFH